MSPLAGLAAVSRLGMALPRRATTWTGHPVRCRGDHDRKYSGKISSIVGQVLPGSCGVDKVGEETSEVK